MDNEFNATKGQRLKNEGMQRALEHAELKDDGWGEKAYQFLTEFAKKNKVFIAEDVRKASIGIIPDPSDRRAWGGIYTRARKEGLIRKIGHASAKASKVHGSLVAKWASGYFEPELSLEEVLNLPLLSKDWTEGCTVKSLLKEILFQTIKSEGLYNFEDIHRDLGDVLCDAGLIGKIVKEGGEEYLEYKTREVVDYLKANILDKLFPWK